MRMCCVQMMQVREQLEGLTNTVQAIFDLAPHWSALAGAANDAPDSGMADGATADLGPLANEVLTEFQRGVVERAASASQAYERAPSSDDDGEGVYTSWHAQRGSPRASW